MALTTKTQIPRKHVRLQWVWHWENKYSNTSQICNNTMCMALTKETKIPPKYVRMQCVSHWQLRIRYLAKMWDVYPIDKRGLDTSQICENILCVALTTETQIPRKYVRIQCIWHWQHRLRYLANMWEYNFYGIDNRDSDSSKTCDNTMCMALSTETQIPCK